MLIDQRQNSVPYSRGRLPLMTRNKEFSSESAFYSEVLLELALASGSSTNLELMLQQALPQYVRKLSCAMGGILDADRDYNLLPVHVPKQLPRHPDWCNAFESIANRYRQGDAPEQFTLQQADQHFYAFRLAEFGALVLARAKPFDPIFLHEFLPVVHLLSRACIACRAFAQQHQTQQLYEAMFDLSQINEDDLAMRECERILHDYVGPLLGSSNFYLAIHNPETDQITFPIFFDEYDPWPPTRPRGNGLTDYVLATGEPLHYCSRNAQHILTEAGFAPLGRMATDWIGAPLKKGSETFGVLALQHYDPHHYYSDQEMQILRHLADKVAMLCIRIRGDQSLRESEGFYRKLFNSMSAGFALHEVIYNEQGEAFNYRYLEVNRAFEEMTGLKAEDLIGHTVLDVLPNVEPSWIQAFCHVATTGESIQMEQGVEELGKFYDVTAYSPRIGQFAVIVTDVTDRRQMEEQRREFERELQHTQKLESLGIMAGGIAHDFNNLLMAILGNLEMAQEDGQIEPATKRHIQEAHNAANHAADLTRQMLRYAGKGTFTTQELNINEVVLTNVDMLKAAMPSGLTFELELASDLPPMEADPSQLQQVIMNLMTNGAEALMGKPGTVRLSTGLHAPTEDEWQGNYLETDQEAETYVWLEVLDTGMGMDETTKQRLFDPFFTTKFQGRGLGLSSVLGIMRQHRGAIFIDSEPGQGTRIRVAFPLLDRPIIDEEPPPATANAPSSASAAPAGTVLIIEDDVAILSLSGSILKRVGFQVLQADSGRMGIELFKQHADDIVGVLLDLTMPDMDGIATLRELRKLRPDIRIILASGFSEKEALARLGEDTISGFIQKPFQLKQLRDLATSVFCN